MKTTKIFAALCCVAALFAACEPQTNDPNNGQNNNSNQNGEDASGSANGYDYVDLGLPSGLKWATCNVGAAKPEEYGDHYAWGETMPKSVYSSDSYLYFATSDVLSMDKDAARVNWGGQWRMPTDDEWTELRENCTWTWTNLNGKNGYEVKGANGNSIFLPAAGYRDGFDSYYAGYYGYYWSSSLRAGNPDDAWGVYFGSDDVIRRSDGRCCGQSVRPVLK